MEPRGRLIFRGLAIYFWLLALSMFATPLQLSEQGGLVLLGTRLAGGENLLWSLTFGSYLAIFGLGLWRMKRFIIGIAHAYALYVVLNLFLHWSNQLPSGSADVLMPVIHAVMAIGTSVLLSLRRKGLG